jgi:hypothetical protein
VYCRIKNLPSYFSSQVRYSPGLKGSCTEELEGGSSEELEMIASEEDEFTESTEFAITDSELQAPNKETNPASATQRTIENFFIKPPATRYKKAITNVDNLAPNA